MANPTPYSRDYSFSGYQATNPQRPLPGPSVDDELNNVELSIGQTIDALADIRRSDGKLKNGIVTIDALSPEVSTGVAPAVEWTTGTSYEPGAVVFFGTAYYRCLVAHISGASFATDLAADKWLLFSDFGPLVADAEAARDAAIAAEADAEAAAAAAAVSQGTASTAAGTATTAAGTATTQAGIATSAAGTATTAAGLAVNALEEFDDTYLGKKTVEPTVDNDGNPLVDGQIYTKTGGTTPADGMYVRTGGAWVQVASSATASGVLYSNVASGLTAANVQAALDEIFANVPVLGATLAATVAGNALTISLKDLAGADPATATPVYLAFRSATAASGARVRRKVSAALSLTISSGSTMGFASGVAGRLWIVAFDDGGTIRLGAVNCRDALSILPLPRNGIKSSTAEGGAGGADSAQVIYTGAAVSAKAYVVLGYLEWPAGLATAGTWNIVPTTIELSGIGGAMPGDVVDSAFAEFTTHTSTSAAIPYDDTIPQVGEGAEFLSAAITPKGAVNIIRGQASVTGGPLTVSAWAVAAFANGAANAIASRFSAISSAGVPHEIKLDFQHAPASAAQQNFTVRAGPNTTGTLFLNGSSGSRIGGGTSRATLVLEELMG